MSRLYLVRHAIAEEQAPSGRDGDRALTDEGREKMRRASIGLREMDVRLDLIVSSPLRRARETAEILAAILGDVPIEIVRGLASGEDPGQALRALRAFDRFEAIAAVGHQPDLGVLASLLLSGDLELAWLPFKKGAVACFETDLDTAQPRGRLEWFVQPGWLRALAKSQS
ncbi:MAG: phosphohistidine phosphatase SixA [Candidatus Binatia bacterium]